MFPRRQKKIDPIPDQKRTDGIIDHSPGYFQNTIGRSEDSFHPIIPID
jgi:hypothetical protein